MDNKDLDTFIIPTQVWAKLPIKYEKYGYIFLLRIKWLIFIHDIRNDEVGYSNRQKSWTFGKCVLRK